MLKVNAFILKRVKKLSKRKFERRGAHSVPLLFFKTILMNF